MTATLFFVTNIVVLYDAYNREPQKWFCVIIQISRISKSGVFKGGISPSGLSPLALYADYPFIIRSYAIYKRQGKAPDGTAYFTHWCQPVFCTAQIFYANAGSGRCNHGAFVPLWYFDRLFHFDTAGSYHDGMYAFGKTCRKTL